MRTIVIPEPAAVVQLDGTPVLDSSGDPIVCSFAAFVRERTCDAAFAGPEGFTMQVVLAAVRVAEACVGEPGTLVKLDLPDWERLVRATQEPTGGYHPAAARCYVSHMLAIVNATLQ